jgi:hypothetical protein
MRDGVGVDSPEAMPLCPHQALLRRGAHAGRPSVMPMQHAVDRSQSEISPVPGPAPGVARTRRGRLGTVAIGILIATLAGSGCRSGVRSMTAPKWPSFGSSKPKGVDDSGLTAAPKVAASINKPSTAATPYPTTSTPAGYVVNDASPTAGGPVPGIQTAATDPGAVTYGVTPPAQVAPPAAESPAAVPAARRGVSHPARHPAVGSRARIGAPPFPAGRCCSPRGRLSGRSAGSRVGIPLDSRLRTESGGRRQGGICTGGGGGRRCGCCDAGPRSDHLPEHPAARCGGHASALRLRSEPIR